MDVSFSIASQTLIVGAEAWSSSIQWDMEEHAHSYPVGWWENEVSSKKELSTVKFSVRPTLWMELHFSNANDNFGTLFIGEVWFLFLSWRRISWEAEDRRVLSVMFIPFSLKVFIGYKYSKL